MDLGTIRQEALDFGFTLAEPIAISTIHLREEVREMCAVNKCHAYNTNWGCPPACGTVEECQERVNSYESGLIAADSAAAALFIFADGVGYSYEILLVQRFASDHC